MTAAAPSAPVPPQLSVLPVLAAATGVQMMATLSALALATLAPAAGAELGVPASVVGYQVSAVYLGAALTSAVASVAVRRWGGGTASVAALVFGLVGSVGLAAGGLWVIAAASLLVGIGYGMTNPASSHLLNRFTPPERRNLVFSLKQTGVPLGGMVAGLALPTLAQAFGWRGAIVAVVGLFAIAVAVLLPMRRRWDDDRQPAAGLRGHMLEGPKLVWRSPPLRGLALTGFCFAAVQLSLSTFVVSLLVKDLEWTLVAAGGTASLLQVTGGGARILWGILADRTRTGGHVLAAIGLVSTATALALATVSADWPVWAVLAVLVAFSTGAIGWMGVFMAEVARMAPSGTVGAATGGAMMVTFAGVVVGPTLFATLHEVVGRYSLTYALMAVFALAGTVALLRVRRSGDQSGSDSRNR